MTALPTDAVVAVIGAGTMGSGIAQVAAQAGHQVLLHDARAGAAEQAIAQTGKALDGLVAKGKMKVEQRQAIIDRLRPAAALKDLSAAGLVIEAVVEDLAVKQALFADLESITAPGAILATNTSSLSIGAIGRNLKAPGRFLGMHFFNPAPILPLVEVVSGLATDSAVAATVHDTAAAWGKTPVHAKSTPGFIVNRCARPFYAEALRLLGEGAADPATIDAAMRESGGFRMGPCELMDLIGHDVNFAVTRSVHAAFFGDPRYMPSVLQQELVESGRLGKKSGRGFYDYAKDAPPPDPRTAGQAPRPRRVAVRGDLGVAQGLLGRIEKSGLPLTRIETKDHRAAIIVDGAVLRLTDGLPATLRGIQDQHALVLYDLCLDYGEAKRIAVAASDKADPSARLAAIGFFQALGFRVSDVDDVPGLVVMRTLAMLVNEAMDAVHARIASPEAIDLAMTKGVNYPRGPLAWGRAVGYAQILAVLDNLARVYGEDRYRASPWLRRVVAAHAAAEAAGNSEEIP